MTEPDPRPLLPGERAAVLAHLSDRFGIDVSVFDRFTLARKGRKYVMITASDHAPPARIDAASAGIPLMRMNLTYPKLTTAGAMLFGAHASRNVVHLLMDEARSFVNGVDLPLKGDLLAGVSGPGYVIVVWDERPLGLGLVLEHEEDDGVQRLKSLYPRRWAPSPIDAAATPTRGGNGT